MPFDHTFSVVQLVGFAAALAGAYVLGSIPFGVLIARAKGVDIRRHGSGNIGATNVGRVLGRKFGLVCFALDFLKGLAPSAAFGVWVTSFGGGSAEGGGGLGAAEILAWLLVAAAAIAGHVLPVWLKFKGGKGVATSAGALLGVFPVMTVGVVAAAAVWMMVAKWTRMVGVSSCAAAVSLPVMVMLAPSAARGLGVPLWNTGVNAAGDGGASVGVAWPYVVVSALLAAGVVYLHRGNIQRTLAGTEPKIGASKSLATQHSAAARVNGTGETR